MLLLRALGNARDSKEAISIIEKLYNMGAVYRYFDFSQCAQDDREELYKTFKQNIENIANSASTALVGGGLLALASLLFL